MAAVVAGLDADVVGLQEIDVRTLQDGLRHQPAELARATDMTLHFTPVSRRRPVGAYGNAILARGAITEAEAVRLPTTPGAAPRVALLAVVRTPKFPMSVAVTHLALRRDEAVAQLAEVGACLLRRPAPHALLGDLNLRLQDVRAVLEPLGFEVAGGEATFPAGEPRVRIDHVAVTGLRLGGVAVPETTASDHRPVVVEAVAIDEAGS